MATISNISVGLIARTGKFVLGFSSAGKSLKKFRRQLAKVRMRQLDKAIAKASRSIRGFRKSFFSVTTAAKVFGGALGVAGAGLSAGISVFTKRAFSSIDTLAKVSEKLGITTEDMAGLNLAAKLTGVETKQLELGLQRMTRRVSEAAIGMGEAQGALKELRLDAKQLVKLAPDKAFLKIAEKIAMAEGQANKIRLAFKLFDSEGVNLIRTLSLGAKGLEKIQQDARLLGIALSRVDAAKIELANNAILKMQAALEGIANQIAIALAPIITNLANRFTEFAKTSRIGSADIVEGFKGIALAGAQVLQGFTLLKAGWLGLQFIIQKGLTGIIGLARIWFKTVSFAAELSPFTPQVVLDSIKKIDTTLANLREKFSEAGDENGKAFADAWEDVLNNQAVKNVEKFFKKVGAKSQQAAADIAKKIKVAPAGGPGGAAKAGAQRTGAFRQVELSRIALGGTAGQRDNLVLDESKRQTALLRTIAQQGQVTRAN